MFNSDVAYYSYRYINGADPQPRYTYRNYLTTEALSFTLGDSFQAELELEMAVTPRQPYGFRSFAMQGKYLILDDIQGDPVSLAAGVSLREVGSKSVRDVSSPYASYFNTEAIFSVGKEFTKTSDWTTRGYLTGAIGIANKGSAWNRFDAVFEGKIARAHTLKGFLLGYFGYGSETRVNPNAFKGWGYVGHKSLDLGVQYKYQFFLWGEIGLSYAYRVFARFYPDGQQTAVISYTLPFSPF